MPDSGAGEPFEALRPGRPIGKRLTLVESVGQRAVFFGTIAVHVFDADDKRAEAACIAMLSRADLASDVDIAAAFGCHRNTVARLAGRLTQKGMAAVVPAKRGPKGPHKVSAAVLEVIAEEGGRMGATRLTRLVARRTGVSLSVAHVRRLAVAHAGQQPELAQAAESEAASGTRKRTGEDNEGEAGTREAGGKPEAPAGLPLPAALPVAGKGPCMGLTLYYPALAALGLVEAAQTVFHLPRSVTLGVQATTLSLFFTTLLGKETVEAAKQLRRREFGAVVGSERAPTVKTLRPRLAELVSQGKASEFGETLAHRWANAGPVPTAFLYVDGQMKSIYTGKQRLQEEGNSERRMPLPGIHTHFVNDDDGHPLLFLTEALTTSLSKAMPRIVDAIREVIGERHCTVVFDRGGYDGKLFNWLTEQEIGFITYQRSDPNRPEEAFAPNEAHFEGRRVRFLLAEDTVTVAGTGPWRRVVIRTTGGRQTPILSNLGPEVDSARIACRMMIARWRQEGVFTYMAERHGIDQLLGSGPGPDASVANPERRRLDGQIADRRKELARLKATLDDSRLEEPDARSAHGLKIARGEIVAQLRRLEADINLLVAVRKALPARVPVADSHTTGDAIRLEHNAIVDWIKLSAYNAEQWMLGRLVPHYPNLHDARDVLRSFAELPGQFQTTRAGVSVTLNPPDTPIHRRALRRLIDDLNHLGALYPGTNVPVTYRVARHPSEAG